MTKRGYFSHNTRGSGDDPTDRARKAGLSFSLSENIAMTHTYSSIINHTKRVGIKNERSLALELVRMWMKSPGHRANILGWHTHIGVGIWINYKKGKVYATQNFASETTSTIRPINIKNIIIIGISLISFSFWIVPMILR